MAVLYETGTSHLPERVSRVGFS